MNYSNFENHRFCQTEDHIHVKLKPASWVLSSAVFGGGYQLVDHIVNLKVSENFFGQRSDFEKQPKIRLKLSILLAVACDSSALGLKTKISI